MKKKMMKKMKKIENSNPEKSKEAKLEKKLN